MTATPSDTATAERRIAPRFQPAYRTICRLNNGKSPMIGLVWNLSETGISMLMADPPRPGAELNGELAPEDGGQSIPINLRVVHVRPTTTGDYILGARFGNPLAADEIKSFVVPPPPEQRGGNGSAAGNWSPPLKG